VTTPLGLQAQFHDGDVIRGFVIVEVGSIHHLRYLGIELLGYTSVKVTRLESGASGPKSFRNKEVFLQKSMALAGTPMHDVSPSLSSSRGLSSSAAVTSHGRIVQLNKGRHILPFELTLETGCTPGSVQWQNHSMPSQATHNVSALLSYKLKAFCQNAESSKVQKVAKQMILVGGFEHSRESLKAMVSKGSGKTKMGTLTFPLMDGQLTYAATLDARAYHLGDTALLTLVVDNKLSFPVNGISVRFNNMISLIGASGKSGGSSSNLSSSSMSSSSTSEETFTETEVLTLMNERYTVKPNESVKRVISVAIPQTAFSTTKYTRSINLMAFLDVTINVQSHTPSVSEKSFQVPIYVINKLPTREAVGTTGIPSSNSSISLKSSSSTIIHPPTEPMTGSTSDSPSENSSSPTSSFKDLQLVAAHVAPGIVIWTNDNEVSQCTVCNKDFTLLRRRHHCRSCGRVMCGRCGKEACVPALFGPKPQKLCTPCTSELQNFLDDTRASTDIDDSSNTLTLSYAYEESISPRNKRSSIQLLSKSTSGSSVISNPHAGAPSSISPTPSAPSSASHSRNPSQNHEIASNLSHSSNSDVTPS
jgi:hypothetical protein